MCLTAKNFGLQEENINISNPQGNTTGWGTTEIERQMDIKRENEGGREEAVLHKTDDKSLIHVENAETTYFDNCAFFAELASFLLQFCLIHLRLAPLACCETYFTFLFGVFIVLSCCRYSSEHRYNFCVQIDMPFSDSFQQPPLCACSSFVT